MGVGGENLQRMRHDAIKDLEDELRAQRSEPNPYVKRGSKKPKFADLRYPAVYREADYESYEFIGELQNTIAAQFSNPDIFKPIELPDVRLRLLAHSTIENAFKQSPKARDNQGATLLENIYRALPDTYTKPMYLPASELSLVFALDKKNKSVMDFGLRIDNPDLSAEAAGLTKGFVMTDRGLEKSLPKNTKLLLPIGHVSSDQRHEQSALNRMGRVPLGEIALKPLFLGFEDEEENI